MRNEHGYNSSLGLTPHPDARKATAKSRTIRDLVFRLELTFRKPHPPCQPPGPRTVGGPGEPSGATRRPRGRLWRPPDRGRVPRLDGSNDDPLSVGRAVGSWGSRKFT